MVEVGNRGSIISLRSAALNAGPLARRNRHPARFVVLPPNPPGSMRAASKVLQGERIAALRPVHGDVRERPFAIEKNVFPCHVQMVTEKNGGPQRAAPSGKLAIARCSASGLPHLACGLSLSTTGDCQLARRGRSLRPRFFRLPSAHGMENYILSNRVYVRRARVLVHNETGRSAALRSPWSTFRSCTNVFRGMIGAGHERAGAIPARQRARVQRGA